MHLQGILCNSAHVEGIEQSGPQGMTACLDCLLVSHDAAA